MQEETIGSKNGLVRSQIFFSAISTILVILCVIGLYRLGIFRWADNYLYDLHFKWRGPISTAGQVVLVLMDQKSAVALKREKASWAREHMAAALENLCGAGAEIIGLDMIFISPDADPGVDQRLAQAIYDCNNVVLARGSSTYGGELISIDPFLNASIGDGFIDLILGEDEVLRRVRYLNAKPLPEGGLELFPSFSLELVRTFLNLDFAFDFSQTDVLVMGQSPKALRLPYPDLIIDYPGNYSAYPILSYADVVQGNFPRDSVSGKLVIIGSSLAMEKDVFTTAYTRFLKPTKEYEEIFGDVIQDVLGAKEIGVACHAHAVDTILSGRFIHKLGPGWIMALIALLGTGGLLFYVPRVGMIPEMLILLTGLAAIIGVSHLAFVKKLLWAEVSPLMGVLALQYVSGVVIQKAFDKRRTSFVTGLFGRYVSYGVVDALIKGNIEMDLEGRSQELTILFSDLRSFTSLSERLGAKATGILLNRYFSNMIPLVFQHQGTLDKLIGDAIMAFFGAPVPFESHPAKAAEAALAMIERLRAMQEEAAVEGIADLRLGIGINTGVVTVGNLGSDDFMDYTVIGDAVNLASRLEGLNKVYGTKIIVSEFTAEGLNRNFRLRELDRVRVKGKASAVTLYELRGRAKQELSPEALELDLKFMELFDAGLAAYRDMEWDDARYHFQRALHLVPEDGPSLLYLQRIEKCCHLSCDDGWDWVTTFDHK